MRDIQVYKRDRKAAQQGKLDMLIYEKSSKSGYPPLLYMSYFEFLSPPFIHFNTPWVTACI